MGHNAFDSVAVSQTCVRGEPKVLLPDPAISAHSEQDKILFHTLSFYFCKVEYYNTHPFVYLPSSDQNILGISGILVCMLHDNLVTLLDCLPNSSQKPCYHPRLFI
jgi:uncharacterized Zn-finger protein